jgi:hypothetical protein
MKIFRITDSFEPAARWYLHGPRECETGCIPDRQGNYELWGKEVMGWRFTTGRKHEGNAPLAIPIQCGTVMLDLTLGSLDMPVLRGRVVQALKPLCGDAIQWVPVVVPGIDEAFQIANALTLVDALDLHRSEISWLTEDLGLNKAGTIAGVGQMVLKREYLSNVTMFRLRDWHPPLLISEVIKNSLEELRVTGIKFQEIAVV